MSRRFLFVLLLLLGFGSQVKAQQLSDWIEAELEAKRARLSAQRQYGKVNTAENNSGFDIGYYGIDLSLNITEKSITGFTVVKGKALKQGLDSVELDFSPVLQLYSVSGDASGYSRSQNRIRINLAHPLASQDTFMIVVHYEGKPDPLSGRGLFFETLYDQPMIYSFNEPYGAREWFPCKDSPRDKADSVDIRITLPDSLYCISNGVLRSTIFNGDQTTTFHWHEAYPIAPYLIAITASQYVFWEEKYFSDTGIEMPVQYWFSATDESKAREALQRTSEMLVFFRSLWGEYPFIREKYAQVQFPWRGGMEHQTCTALGTFAELLTCHELAHQWWGDMISCASWQHIWLNEGFARYAEALWTEHLGGRKELQNYMNWLNRPEYWNNTTLFVLDTTRVQNIFSWIVYDKGAWLLHMLRGILGEAQFSQLFQTYRQRFGMQSVVTEDFQRVCEEVSGQDLEWFFNQWVYGVGQPTYKVSWCRSYESANRWRLRMKLEQIQTTTTQFKMPLQLAIGFAVSDTLVTIGDSLQIQEFEMVLAQKPLWIKLDPEDWVLKKVLYYATDSDWDYRITDFYLSQAYPNPFNGSVFCDLYLPHDVNGKLAVFDILGREVQVLATGTIAGGFYLKVWLAASVPTGIYFIRFDSREFQALRKVMLLK
jgi:aminopeptidase N